MRLTKKRAGLGVALAVLVAASVAYQPDLTARVGAGTAAHNLCSATFVSGVDTEATFREFVQPLVGDMVASLISYRVDRTEQSVTASFAWLKSAKAKYSPSYGCRIEYAGNLAVPPAVQIAATDQDDLFAPQHVVVSADPSISKAIAQVFAEAPGATPKRVKALVIVKDGRVIAERYAPGFGIDTPVLSYSVAKSVTNALLGILVQKGRLRVSDPVGAPEWGEEGDPRRQITLEDLLRMTSGLDAPETGSGFDASTRMLYAYADMAGFAAEAAQKTPRGAVWEYTSANTILLSRALGAKIGGGAKGMRVFAQSELFGPLGMRDVTMEFDGAGTFIGSSYVYAPARAFARFGLLYANDGIAPGGKRLLPEDWVTWSHRATLGAPYGAGFWTNDGKSEHAAGRIAAGFPKDGFFASGNMGQRIYIIPSQKLVIARFGYSDPPMFGLGDDLNLIKVVIASKS